MPDPHENLRPNTEDVAAKVMDGEAILINLTNGYYYSMDKVGGFVWSLIEQGRSLPMIAAAVAARYDVEPERAEADVRALAEELLREELVRPADEEAEPPGDLESEPGPKLPYEPPELQSYRDMADLLALDPPMPGLTDVPWKAPAEPPADEAGRSADE